MPSIEIIPAILPKSLKGLEQSLERLKGVSKLVQIDLVGTNVLGEEEAVPFWEEFDFEFDIMLGNQASEVETCIALGGSRIIVHAQGSDAREALEKLQDKRSGEYAIAVGIALGVDESVETLKNFEGLYDFVQVMGIAHIGKQGEPFDDRAIALVHAVRGAYPELPIQVDGAAATHVRELVQAGATRLIVGSAIINAENPKEVLKSLYNEANVSK